MGSLKQYIDLYDANRDTIEAHSAPLLNSRRRQARLDIQGMELPRRGDEGYEKTSIDDMLAPDFGVNIARVDIPVDPAKTFRCDIPGVSTLLALVVNDAFRATDTLAKNLPQGVTVTSLARAAHDNPGLVGRHYGSAADNANPAVALNTLMAQDGVFIHIAAGTRLQRPLQLVNIFSSPAPLAAFRRVLIVADAEASAQIVVCDHTQDTATAYLSQQVVEIITGPGASIEICDIEESSPLTSRHSLTYARQAQGSTLRLGSMTLLAGNTRNDFNISLDSPGARSLLTGMVIADGSAHVDNSSSVYHRAERCASDQLFKYVLDGSATGAFEGGITVTPQGRFTEAYQSNRNVLASTDARMHSKPQLLIYNDDVKCSHGATTGQLDQAALFYMRTRGIPLDQARTMLMQAFMADVIDNVTIAGLNDRLRHLVEKRLSGQPSLCGDCHSDCPSPQR